MKEQTVQKELFKEFETKTKRKKRDTGILPKNYMILNISYEQVTFIAIALIMLTVFVFSLGVERGRLLERSSVKIPGPPPRIIEETKKEEVGIVKPEEKIESVEDRKVTAIGPKPFTIQVIAYRSKRSAQKELVKLSEKGYKPFIIVGGGYYQICVGEYTAKDEAKDELAELKKLYKDSFVRKR